MHIIISCGNAGNVVCCTWCLKLLWAHMVGACSGHMVVISSLVLPIYLCGGVQLTVWQVTGAASKASDKAGENTPDVNVPGFGPFKFNPKEDAKQAASKNPLGFMNVGVVADAGDSVQAIAKGAKTVSGDNTE